MLDKDIYKKTCFNVKCLVATLGLWEEETIGDNDAFH